MKQLGTEAASESLDIVQFDGRTADMRTRPWSATRRVSLFVVLGQSMLAFVLFGTVKAAEDCLSTADFFDVSNEVFLLLEDGAAPRTAARKLFGAVRAVRVVENCLQPQRRMTQFLRLS